MKSVHTKGKRSCVRFAVGLFSLILTAFTVLSCEVPESRDVAVFMYHDFVHDGESAPWAVTESVFEAHVKALSDAGYTGVDFADLSFFILNLLRQRQYEQRSTKHYFHLVPIFPSHLR